MILITGAAGQFGSATIDFLLQKGITPSSIIAFVRDAAKAEALKNKGVTIRVGDYDNYDSMLTAFTGVDKLLLVSGTDIANRLKQQENAVKAAKEAGVKHILYTSFVRKNETETSPIAFLGASHIGTDEAIKASGIPYTIMRNNLYADVLPMFFGEKVLETGIFYPAGDGKAAYTTRLDMAEAAANILASEGHENKIYTLSNDENYDLNEVSAILSEVTGKNVPYINPSVDVYTQALTQASVPAEYIGLFVGFGEAIKQGEFDTTASDLATLLGRKPTSLKTYFQTLFSNN